MSMRSTLLRFLLAAAVVLLALQQTVVRGKVDEQPSIAMPGTVFANGPSVYPEISVDGRYVAFFSPASNLVPGDTNGYEDIFLRDRVSGSTERVSISSSGQEGNDGSWGPAISADGRYVTFDSLASNLVSGDTNGTWDIFVRDRLSGSTERVSISSSGQEGNGDSWAPAISPDGRYVAFSSGASNLVSGDTNATHDIFVRDRLNGTTERLSVSSSGQEGNDDSWDPAISADGRYVAFYSAASNLVPSDTNWVWDIFVRDRLNGTTERVSVSSSEQEGNDYAEFPGISADGRYVSFYSYASNLVPSDTNGYEDVFVRDRLNGTTERVSLSSSGQEGNSLSQRPDISADGRYVAFESYASNLVPGDNNATYDIFVRDRLNGTTELISVPNPPAEKLPIVFLPGVMGSRLQNRITDTSIKCLIRPGGEVWPGLEQPLISFQVGLSTLIMDIDGLGPMNDCDQITKAGIIGQVPIIGTDVYYDFLNHLLSIGYEIQDIHIFDYDWRLDIDTIAGQLDTFIQNDVKAPKVILIGHSMGGLVARAYVDKPERMAKVDKVVTVGTPYWGAPKLAYAMRAGRTGVEFFDAMKSFYANYEVIRGLIRNSPGIMQLLPSEAYLSQGLEGGYYRAYDLQLTNYDETKKFFADHGQNIALMDKAELFHKRIDSFKNWSPNPDFSYWILAGNHVNNTYDGVIEYSCLNLYTCWEATRLSSGDGTVPWTSARLSGKEGDWSGVANVCTLDALSEEHGTMMGDPKVITAVDAILKNIWKSETDCNKIGPEYRSLQVGDGGLLQVAVIGPALVSVVDEAGRFAGPSGDFIQNQIPGASYDLQEVATVLSLPAPGAYSLTIRPETQQGVELRLTEFSSPSVEDPFTPQEKVVFLDAPAGPGSILTLPLDLTAGIRTARLKIDQDGNGSVDLTQPPTSVLTGAAVEDYTMPVTSAGVSGNKDSGGNYVGNVKLTLSATDDLSGVYQTQYSLDRGQSWLTYTGQVTINANATALVYASSADRAGNIESPWVAVHLSQFDQRVYLPLTRR